LLFGKCVDKQECKIHNSGKCRDSVEFVNKETYLLLTESDIF